MTAYTIPGISRKDAKQMVGPGWSSLLDKLYDVIPAGTIVSNVKEKFGMLQFDVYSSTMEFLTLIEFVEKESNRICETCGQPGKPKRISGWVKTICEDCLQRIIENG